MADGFHIDAAWLDALDNYVHGLLQDTHEAAQVSANFLVDRVFETAKAHPEWTTMADNIQVWSNDGYLVLGVQDDVMVSEAFALEYGDDNRPPTPLFRKLNALVPQVEDRLQRELLARRGSVVIPGMKV